MNCFVSPLAIVVLSGLTAIDVSEAALTVTVELPEIAPEVAVMSEAPAVTAVTTPLLSTVATASVPESHVTDVLISWRLPSE